MADAVLRALSDDSRELSLPWELNGNGLGPDHAIGLVTPYLRARARDLGHPGFLAHMDPPTPWVSWVAALLGASSNQNLLHPDTAPAARDLEATVVGWLAPRFGMGGGHLVPGSTVANLTALWAARDRGGAETVVTVTDHVVQRIGAEPLLEVFGPNRSGVVAWRHRRHRSDRIRAELVGAFVSSVDIDGTDRLRSVAANPLADPDLVVDAVLAAGRRLDRAGDQHQSS